MGLIPLLLSNPLMFLVLAFLLLYSVILHEIAHGFTAHLFGDDTALRYGRLTLNPVSHVDPVGALMLFLVGFGWAKPVPVDFYFLKNNRLALFCVALSGCFTNILIAIISLFFLKSGLINSDSALAMMLAELVKINIILGAFNLIPIPPLDGSKIVMSFLPEQLQFKIARLEPYGLFILLILIFTGLLDPLIMIMLKLVYSLIGLFF